MSIANLGTMSLPVWLALSLMICSCSVKEDRHDCPCFVHLVLDEFIRAGFRDASLSFDSGGNIFRDDVELVKYSGCPYEIALPRSETCMSVVSGSDGFVMEDNVLSVPYGQESGPLWLFHDRLDCSGDEEYVRAVPFKQYCCLTVIVSGLPPDEEYDCSMTVRADCCGIGLLDAGPVEGKYCATVRKTARNTFSVRIPRQSGNSLFLDILPGGNGPSAHRGGQTAWTFDLGQEFSGSGYDWTKQSLDDVSAVVDCSRAEVSVSVEEWEFDDSFGNMEI